METPDRKTELLLTYLAAVPVPCPRCAYDLHDLRSPRCPECGDELVLTVGLAHPRLGAFVTGVVGLAAGSGFSGLIFLFMVILSITQPGSGPAETTMMGVTLACSLIEGIALGGWLRYRRRLGRLGTTQRYCMAGLCWALTAASFLGFFKVAY